MPRMSDMRWIVLCLYCVSISQLVTAFHANQSISQPLTLTKRSQTLDVAIAKGLKRYQQLQAVLGQQHEKASDSALDALRQHGWRLGSPLKSQTWSDLGVGDVPLSPETMKSLGITQGKNVYHTDLHLGPAHFVNYISPINGLIIAWDNRREGAPVHWSDVVFAFWQKTCKKLQVAMASLRAIVRVAVRNRSTIELIHELDVHQSSLQQNFRPEGIHVTRETSAADLSPSQRGFFAFLGTDNGAGIIPLLTQHSASLGHKRLVQITRKTWFDEEADDERPPTYHDLIFYLQDVVPSAGIQS